MEQLQAADEPCRVCIAQGFSVSYKGRFLYSKYNPSRTIEAAIENLTILPGTLIIASSPLLWLGLNSLLKKLPEDCFILGLEFDQKLHDFATDELEKLVASGKIPANVKLLPYEFNDYIVNILTRDPAFFSGAKEKIQGFLPHISTFRRALLLEMSGGFQIYKDQYRNFYNLAQNTIASFWKNRITLTKLGRLYSHNLFKNLANLVNSIDLSSLTGTIDKPIFVFGAGESLEEMTDTIPPALIEKCYTIAVDAASPFLKEYSIRIDAVIAQEGQLAIEKAYIGNPASSSLIIADMCSRIQVTNHTSKGFAYFSSRYTDSDFFTELSQRNFFPPLIPPLGSVGLTAVYLALMLRKNTDIPVFFAGLDFSFTLGRTHAKSTPAHIARLTASDRFTPVENYASAFKKLSKKIPGKNGIEVFTDAALENYSKSFIDAFYKSPNLYDVTFQGLPLTKLTLTKEELLSFLQNYPPLSATLPQYKKMSACREEIRERLENEEKALNRIKELLMFGNEVASCSMTLEEELYSLIKKREYLFLHFPDGYKCRIKDISFLKRIRGQIDFFLKDIKNSLQILK